MNPIKKTNKAEIIISELSAKKIDKAIINKQILSINWKLDILNLDFKNYELTLIDNDEI